MIWWINQYARTPDCAGGTRHFCLARELIRRGIPCTIIKGTFDHLGPQPMFENLAEPTETTVDGVPFLVVPTRRYRGSATPSRLFSMWRFGRDVERGLLSRAKVSFSSSPHDFKRGSSGFEPPQPAPSHWAPAQDLTGATLHCVIGSTVHPFAALAGYRVACALKVPFVYEVRDLWPQSLVDLGRISPRHPLVLYFARLDKLLATQAARVITTAPLMKNYYIERYALPEEKFTWITNGTSEEFFGIGEINTSPPKGTSPPAPLLSGEGCEHGEKISLLPSLAPWEREGFGEGEVPLRGGREVLRVLYTGAFGQANDVMSVLVQLAQTDRAVLSRFEFHFYGDGPDAGQLAAFVKEANLPCTFHAPVPKQQVPELLAGADILFSCTGDSPVYRYGISKNKLADYHAAARPVISVGDYAADPVAASGAGWCVKRHEDLPATLAHIASLDRDRFRELGLKGRAYAREHYTWEALGEKVAGVL